MDKPKIAVFSGPTSTIANSPNLVTSNKGRADGDRNLPGRFDHLVAQSLYEPVTVRIKKFSAHPMEEDAKGVYFDDGKDYYEVELHPEDGPFLLPYMARRKDGSGTGAPFEAGDMTNAAIGYGGRQSFYPDASRVFADIDRSIAGRDEHGEGNLLDRKADFEFIRALPPAGYTELGEKAGEDYFPYQPFPMSRRPRYSDLARVTNTVQRTLAQSGLAGAIWLEGSPTVEETTYWLSLLIDTQLPLTCCASQRTHGQLANDGDRNIVDAVEVILSGQVNGMGAVGVQDERIYAAREFKKADDRQLQSNRRPWGNPGDGWASSDHLVPAQLQAHCIVGREPDPAAGRRDFHGHHRGLGLCGRQDKRLRGRPSAHRHPPGEHR